METDLLYSRRRRGGPGSLLSYVQCYFTLGQCLRYLRYRRLGDVICYNVHGRKRGHTDRSHTIVTTAGLCGAFVSAAVPCSRIWSAAALLHSFFSARCRAMRPCTPLLVDQLTEMAGGEVVDQPNRPPRAVNQKAAFSADRAFRDSRPAQPPGTIFTCRGSSPC